MEERSLSLSNKLWGDVIRSSHSPKKHKHNYIEKGNYLICSCGKKVLNLKKSNHKGVFVGVKGDGTLYSVRDDRRRYFFPDEWELFINSIKNKERRFFYVTLLHTGARIMEALNLKYKDIDVERGTVNLEVVKQRKAKKSFSGKSRGFFVAENYIREYKSFIRGRNVNPNDYMFLDNSKLPSNYDDLENKDKKKYYASMVISYSKTLKRQLKKIGISDWYNFSPHNIRKTYGMWMRTFNKDFGDLCYRMGHDMNTYIAHYGSSLIFTENERRKIQKIFGEVK